MPERVPFRMTQNLETALGLTGVEVLACIGFMLISMKILKYYSGVKEGMKFWSVSRGFGISGM